MGTGDGQRRRGRRLGALGAVVALALSALIAPAAHAGEWIQVSCTNPNGSAAPSEGWSTSSTPGVSPLSSASTLCGPGTPMQAFLSNGLAVSPNASEDLQYTPPAGSSLVGGTLAVDLSADGYSEYGRAVAAIEEPGDDLGGGDGVFSCIYGEGCGSTAGTVTSGSDWSGTVTLPSDREGDLYVSALCTALSASNCSEGGTDGAYAFAQVSAADLLLSSDAVPAASGFSGSALQGRVHGTGQLVFTATESDGPGVFVVTVSIDGRVLSSTTPDTDGGTCAAVGTGSGGALEFDHQQPCPPSVAVDAAIPTAGLPDGRHRLTVTVTDAAGNAATVLDQLITTSNPQTTPRPPRGIKARFVISWNWSTHTTVLRSIEALHLPRSARLTVSCQGPRCPRLRVRSASASHVGRLLRELGGTRFRPRDRILLTVTEGHRRPERIAIFVRSGRIPRARLGD